MKVRFLPALFLLICTVAQAALPAPTPDGLWIDVAASDIAALPAKSLQQAAYVQPETFRAVWLDESALDDLLGTAPPEVVGDAARFEKSDAVIWLPFPDGTNVPFAVVESPIMAPELGAKYPTIVTYAGRSMDGRKLLARMDRTPRGFHAMVLGGKAVYIDPQAQDGVYASYFVSDYRPADKFFTCEVEGSDEPASKKKASKIQLGATLRTYRLAVACTAEYAAFHGGTTELALAAIVTTINRVTGIYETDVSVRMTLIANNDDVVYTNALSDPFSTDPSIFTLQSQSQSTINSVIGAANYDIGHTVSTGDIGGFANIACVCVDDRKALGATGSSSPIGDPFDVDYVAHEMGHQFSAEHTFNTKVDGCKQNRVKKSAYERGGGTTIMSYAGICGPDDLEDHSDPIFHSESIDQILEFVSSTSCDVESATGNAPPTISAGGDYTIPKQTPFVLTASGSDGYLDTLTYAWEERDLGDPQFLTDNDNGESPLFRGFAASLNSQRVIPQLATLQNGDPNGNTFELLPTKARTMKFWVVARDNNGGVNTDEKIVVVNAGTGPFEVTYPNTSVTIKGGKKKAVKWNVAGTSGAPVNTANVRILLSTDGGATYPKVLAASTPNDGQQKVKFPKTATADARVKVEALSNIYFDVSNHNFTIEVNP